MLSIKQFKVLKFQMFMAIHVSLPILLLLLLTGCTSIQWQDSKGYNHHLGLFWVEVTKRGSEKSLSRHSLGADLRIAGIEPGFTVGYNQSLTWLPDTKVVEDYKTLGPMVFSCLKNPDVPKKEEIETEWSFFYFCDRDHIEKNSTVYRSQSFGLDLSRSPAGVQFSVGYDSRRHLCGKAFNEGIVQILIEGPDSSELLSVKLWELK